MRMASGFDDMTLEDLRRRRSYKWRLYPPDVVPAFVAEMDFRLAPPLASAIAEAAAIGDCGYAWRDTELAAALSGFAQRRFSWTVDPGDVVLIPDVMAGVVELLRMVCEPGDGVVINTPAYPPFFSHIEEARCRVVEAPLAPGEHRFELDLEALEAAFLAGARVFLLSNPHNPTGRVFSRPELQGVAELAERYDVLVFSDEIHAPLVLPGAVHVPFLTLDEPAVSRCIALVSASKGWNIPGLKCAQAVVASDAMREVVGGLGEDVTFRVGHLGVLASTAAPAHGRAADRPPTRSRVRGPRGRLSRVGRLPQVGYRRRSSPCVSRPRTRCAARRARFRRRGRGIRTGDHGDERCDSR